MDDPRIQKRFQQIMQGVMIRVIKLSLTKGNE